MNKFDIAWSVLKALPEQQLFSTDEDTYGYPELGEIEPDVYGLGTIHPAALAMARRKQAKSPLGSVQIQRLEEPDYGIQERTGSPEYVPYDERNVEDIKRYGGAATGHYDPKHPDFRIKPNYPNRDPTYFDTPLNLEGGK
jgi:hypothetical protein